MNTIRRYNSGDIGHEIAPRGIEDQTVDRFTEGGGPYKCSNYKKGSNQRYGRADTLCGRDGQNLMF